MPRINRGALKRGFFHVLNRGNHRQQQLHRVATVSGGTNTIAVIAANLGGYAVTNNYQVVVPAGGTTSPQYDFNGNLSDNGAGQTYEWDAKDELVAINYTGGARSEFTYDGRQRRVKIVETGAGATIIKQFVWLGDEMAEERDADNLVTKRFFDQGEQIGTANYYYTRDHLGSVREMTDGSGTIQARYDYDPYGRTTLVSGTDLATKQYAGMMKHVSSGLYLTPFGNTYDPNTGRWIGRDPLGEEASLNLYAYCANEPIDTNDPLGLDYHLHNDIHQWVTVDDGHGGHHTYSFDNPSYPSPYGPGKWYQDGTLDQDMAHKYPSATTTDYHSTPEQDAALNKAFQDKVKAQAESYNLFDYNGSNCRKASDDVIDKTLGPNAWQPGHHYGPVTTPHGGRKGWGQID